MKNFVWHDGKVVCEKHLRTDYDINEQYGYNCAAADSFIEGMDIAPAGAVCWLCNEEDPA